MGLQDKPQEQSIDSEDTIQIVESPIESDLSTECSKDENENRKDKRASERSSPNQKIELLDLPDNLVRHILRFLPLTSNKKQVVAKRFCSPNAANNACKVHGGISVTCKRLHRLSCERKSKGRLKKDIAQVSNLPIRHLEIPVGQEQLRLTYGDDNPSEKWTHCYKSIDKIIRYGNNKNMYQFLKDL